MVRVHDADIWLTCALFTAFCELCASRLHGDAAGPKISGTYIQRLREALDEAIGRDDFGASLIRPAGKGTYVLALPGTAVRVDQSLRHVPLTNGELKQLVDRLLTHCKQ